MKAFAPDGTIIIGTSDLIPGTARASDYHRNADGTIGIAEYDGETDVCYDAQEPKTDARGKALFVDDNGNEWPEDSIHLEGEEPRAIPPDAPVTDAKTLKDHLLAIKSGIAPLSQIADDRKDQREADMHKAVGAALDLLDSSPPVAPVTSDVLDMLRSMTDSYEEAIEVHIYGDDEPEDDCEHEALVAKARQIIAAAEAGPVVPSAIDWRSIAQDLAGALSSCSQQIEQMRGMFDDGDGTIAEALEAADEAEERYRAVSCSTEPATFVLPPIAVVIEGGNVSAVISDDPTMIGRDITIIDYDTDDAETVVMIPQDTGKPQRARVWGEIIGKAGLDIVAVRAMEPEPVF